MNPLTGLPGNLIIEHEIRRLVAPGHGLFAVLYADFNHFKAYNDVYGFPAGDEAIRLLARVLTTTVAELGNGNRPLDMILYQKDGKDYLLMANSRHGILKVPTENIGKIEGITERIQGTAGVAAQKVEELKGVVQLDKLDKNHALVLVTEGGSQNLETIALP